MEKTGTVIARKYIVYEVTSENLNRRKILNAYLELFLWGFTEYIKLYSYKIIYLKRSVVENSLDIKNKIMSSWDV